MSIVLRTLQGRALSSLKTCSTPPRQPVLVVTFIALLELAKETLIEITQAEAFAPFTCASWRAACTACRARPG
jgi:segregation and condensation protein A